MPINRTRPYKNALEEVTGGMLDQFKTREDMKNKLGLGIGLEMAKQQFKDPLETAKTQSEIDKNNAMASSYKNSSSGGEDFSPEDIELFSQEMGVPKEDLYLKPTVTKFRGQTKVTRMPDLKPMVGEKEAGNITALRNMRNNINNNLSMMTPAIEKKMNPFNPMAARGGLLGGFGVKIASIGDKDWADFGTFKAETDKLFQDFRKQTTGAQAALKELGWLAPDYPEPNDPPMLYKRKAEEALKRIQQGEDMLLNAYSQAGYRVGHLRENKLVKSANQNVSGSNSNKDADRQEAKRLISTGQYDSKAIAEDFQREHGEPL